MTRKIATQPEDVFKEYDKGKNYKSSIGIYETTERNQNFYLGDQWNGVNAPDIEKPVLNILRQAVDYYVSMLVSDDISVQANLPEDTSKQTREVIGKVVGDEIDKVFEQTNFKSECRTFLKNCVVDGDACFYWRYNSEKQIDREIIGGIDLELIDNTNVIFGNPADRRVQKQPYIMIIQKLTIDELKELCVQNKALNGNADPEMIVADNDSYSENEADAGISENYATLITKFYKQDKKIWCVQTTSKVYIKKPFDLNISLYPISYMSWNKRKQSYHGQSPLSSVIQNQIIINKYYMMLNEFMKKLAFPKLLYDKTKFPKGWTNKIEAIGVNGSVTDAIASTSPTIQMSQQVIQYIQDMIEKTKETMGVYDVALGNARPENTSAIIALQKTASQPLELQKMDYYQMIEDSVRIILDLMAGNYGTRNVIATIPLTDEEFESMRQTQIMNGMTPSEEKYVEKDLPFDYAEVGNGNIDLQIEVGAAAYWSELMQVQTLDNMYAAKIIPDSITYVEQLPNGILKSKKDIIEAIKNYQNEQQRLAIQQSMMQMPPQV